MFYAGEHDLMSNAVESAQAAYDAAVAERVKAEAVVRAHSEVGLAEYILKLMRGTREDTH